MTKQNLFQSVTNTLAFTLIKEELDALMKDYLDKSLSLHSSHNDDHKQNFEQRRNQLVRLINAAKEYDRQFQSALMVLKAQRPGFVDRALENAKKLEQHENQD